MTSSTDSWSFFDKIYCISIDTRIDRRYEAKRQFDSCGFLDRVEFVLVTRHPKDREEGIFNSHMQCIRMGLEAGAQRILIFEDDILLKKFNSEGLHRATAHLHKKPSWQAFFLGALCTRIQPTSEPAISTIDYRCLAHGYAVNRPFAKHLLHQSWSGVPYDTLLQQQCRDFFALSPMIAYQSSASTDNQTMILDRFRRLFGGLPLIQRGSEFFQTHKGTIVTLHLLFLAALLAIWLK